MVRQEIKSFNLSLDGRSDLACESPCSLYSVLYDNGIIGDPSVSDNAAKAAVYSSKGCEFYSDFEITPLIMSMKNVVLRFHGIDTLCRIEINGREVGFIDNMHRTYDFDVKTKLVIGKNRLRLVFSPVTKGANARKSCFAFGNEGTPEFADMGIFRRVEILAFNHKIISDVRVKQTHTDKSVRLDLSVSTIGYDELSRAVATLTSPAGNVYFCGFVGGEGSITVTEPNLWWPNGLGMQNLYKLTVNLYSDSDLEDTREIRIGLRTVSISRDSDKPAILVNGERMLAMGGEYMSEDILLSRLTEKRTRALLEAAKHANFNSIFIHGSGYYPDNYFFDACDELGLAVWLDIPFCDNGATVTEALCDNVRRELCDNLTRIAHHPSTCVILGSESLAKVAACDTDGAILRSISGFDGMNVFDLKGECRDKIVRIGHDSLPTYDTVTKFAVEGERNLGSEVFEQHGADEDSVMTMLTKAYSLYPHANGMNELSYTMGLSSAVLSMADVEAARRETTKPMAIFMRRMNDSWPSLSPSGVDYYGNKKPLHYYERAFFSPVRISAVQNGTRVKFIVSNDMRLDYVGIFTYQILNNKNQPIFRDSFPIRARASSNLEVHNVDLGSVIKGHEREYYLYYSVADKSNEASVSTYLFTKTKRFNFLKPNFKIDISGNGMEYVAAVSSDCYAKGVELSFDGVDAELDKNYFDISGKAPIRVRIRSSRMTTIEKLKRGLKVRSVYDLGQEK